MQSHYDHYSHQAKFPVAVDCVVFGYEDDTLKLLLYPRRFEPQKGDWSLMGGFVHQHESIGQTVARVLSDTVGLQDIFVEQVAAYFDPERDPGGRVISIAHYALIRISEHDNQLVDMKGGVWWPITNVPNLIFDHELMVADALKKLQFKATYHLIGKDLLPEHFTLTQLNNLYNAIFQQNFNPGNFRKKLATLHLLHKLDKKDTDGSKRGAYYYTFNDEIPQLQSDRIVKVKP
jgi:8-oxo-dGTP diphosphatase